MRASFVPSTMASTLSHALLWTVGAAGNLAATIQDRVKRRLRDLHMLMGDYDAIASSGESGEMPHRIVLHCHMARLNYNWLVAAVLTMPLTPLGG